MIKYARGSYNKCNETEQWIRISEGCPNNCKFCRETEECGSDPIYFNVPKIVRNKVKIMDMNLIYKPRCLEILNELGNQKVNGKVVYYELICGIDYRFMTREIANALKRNRFKNIRLAWDHGLNQQKLIKRCIKMLINAGYKSKELSVFMICNWKVTMSKNIRKLDLCKVWNVKVCDCWYDNQLSPHIKPIYWTDREIMEFRRQVRKHNQLVLFEIDPEHKSEEPNGLRRFK